MGIPEEEEFWRRLSWCDTVLLAAAVVTSYGLIGFGLYKLYVFVGN